MLTRIVGHLSPSNLGPLASGLGGEETWRLAVTYFDATWFAPYISHYKWQKCSQPTAGLY